MLAFRCQTLAFRALRWVLSERDSLKMPKITRRCPNFQENDPNEPALGLPTETHFDMKLRLAISFNGNSVHQV